MTKLLTAEEYKNLAVVSAQALIETKLLLMLETDEKKREQLRVEEKLISSLGCIALDMLTALDVIGALKAEVADLNAQLVDAKNDAAEARGTLPQVEWR